MPVKQLNTSPVAKALGGKQNLKPKTKASTPAAKRIVARVSKLSVPVYSLSGKKKGLQDLPKEIFGAKVNKALMAQAVRVYLVNQRQGNASTKTRGEVTGSTRKIYRQKGTGRARHGAISAPIFVGGGIVFGPRKRNLELKFSKQMKKRALFSALSEKLEANQVFVVDASSATGKTKEIYSLFKAMNLIPKNKAGRILFVLNKQAGVIRAAKNIEKVNIKPAHGISTYDVITSNALIFAKEALLELSNNFIKDKKN